MKRLLIVAFAVAIFGGNTLAADPDLFARNALYIGGKLVADNKMNEGAKFVTPTAPLTVSTADSYYQKDGKYYFKVAYYLHIRREKEGLSTMLFYNSLTPVPGQNLIQQVQPKPDDKNVVGYGNGFWTIIMRGSLVLSEGTTKITLKLDSNGVVTETDEQNNLYAFQVTFKK